MANIPIISLENVCKFYGSTKIIESFSLDVRGKKFTCFLGNSGSGKTTILRLVAGLEKPDSGIILIDGEAVSDGQKILVPPSQRGIGFIFQDLALWPHLTMYDNIAFGLKVRHRANIEAKIREMLDFFAISDHAQKYPHQLSGGQQQLVAIARSLTLNPRILLMDEPLANLDVKLKSKIRKQIKELIRQFSVTIIYVTHDHHEALQLADEIVVLNNGKIEQTGTPEEIRHSDNEFVREFIEA